jgi:hypothetical protein
MRFAALPCHLATAALTQLDGCTSRTLLLGDVLGRWYEGTCTPPSELRNAGSSDESFFVMATAPPCFGMGPYFSMDLKLEQ